MMNEIGCICGGIIEAGALISASLFSLVMIGIGKWASFKSRRCLVKGQQAPLQSAEPAN